MIYLDHAATTPVPRAVADAMYEVLTEQFGNPSSQYPIGKSARDAVAAARETIAAALHAAGIRTLGHSPHLHRPRGLFCAIGNCSSCFMTVDGEPNVRVCVTRVKAGMKVEEQHGKGVVL